MKKNRMMRLASILLVCVLLTTSVISGTFAKYTTSYTANDSARVAKWGFDQASLSFDLFANNYDNSVESADGVDVIAPGTTKTATFTFVPATMAAPEVDYKITVDTNGSGIHYNIENNPNIVWQLDEGEFGTWQELLTAIAGLSVEQVEANNFPAAFSAGTEHKITWKWIFDEDATNKEADTNNMDVMDTNMGNGAISTEQSVVLVINILAEQLD